LGGVAEPVVGHRQEEPGRHEAAAFVKYQRRVQPLHHPLEPPRTLEGQAEGDLAGAVGAGGGRPGGQRQRWPALGEEVFANVLVSATGQFNRSHVPAS
jgi:hypothetical protein